MLSPASRPGRLGLCSTVRERAGGRALGRPGGAGDGSQRQSRGEGRRKCPGAALAAGYDRVFLITAGLGLAIAVVSVRLPRHRRG